MNPLKQSIPPENLVEDEPDISSNENNRGETYSSVDYRWFDDRFANLMKRLVALESSLHTIHEQVTENGEETTPDTNREYYSVLEFSELVARGEYTVREWCRLMRINAEKCESGRGEAKSWKIPVDELARYRDHGLLPASYLR